LQEIEQSALTAEQRARISLNFQNDLVGAAGLAISYIPDQFGLRIQLLQCRLYPQPAANDRSLACHHPGLAALPRVHQASRQVSGPEVFV
jgi:hypothetical protein